MTSSKALNKIETFVKEQVQSPSSVVITETGKGYKVNNYRIHLINDYWVLLDIKGIEIQRFLSQRLAVLSAALTVKKKHNLTMVVANLDKQLNGLNHDKRLFEYKVVKSIKSHLFEDRLSRTMGELSTVYYQISELEKSVGLQ